MGTIRFLETLRAVKDFYGFDLGENYVNNSSDSESEDQEAANLPQAPQQDVHVDAYDQPWL